MEKRGKKTNQNNNFQPSISRDSILTIDDFETADKHTGEVDESTNNLETATEDSDLSKEVRSHQKITIKDIGFNFNILQGSVKEKDSKDDEDPVRAWMCAVKIQWLCQAGNN